MPTFKSRVDRLEDGIRMHVIPVPDDILKGKLLSAKRVLVEIGGVELNRAIQGKKSGSPYIVIGIQVLNSLGLRLGSSATVKIKADPEAEKLEIAAELLEAIGQDEAASARWESFPPGKKRSLNIYVDGAKREDTRIRRAVELAEKIATYTLHGDKNPDGGAKKS